VLLALGAAGPARHRAPLRLYQLGLQPDIVSASGPLTRVDLYDELQQRLTAHAVAVKLCGVSSAFVGVSIWAGSSTITVARRD
jgi:hypothetical protein